MQANDYQLRLALLIKEKTVYLVTGMCIVLLLAIAALFSLKIVPFTPSHQVAEKTVSAPAQTAQVQTTAPQIQKAADAVPMMPPLTAKAKTYTVKSGDYLWGIAQDVYGDGSKAYDIAKANNIDTPSTIYAGTVLTLPNLKGETLAANTPQPSSVESGQITEKAAMTTQVPTQVKNYTVAEGDSLWDIAQKVYGDGLGWTEIAKANNIASPDTIFTGTVLSIPPKS